MPLLSEEDLASFGRDGYVVVEDAVPPENCEAVIDAIWAFLGQDPDDPESWYEPPAGMDDHFESQGAGMIEMYHSQAQWNNYQHPRVYQAVAEILDEERLWVHLDRVNMTPPAREDAEELDSSFVHWDLDPTDLSDPIPRPNGIQGVLYLDDTSERQGGFQCVPDLYREIRDRGAAWFADHPEAAESRSPDVDDEDIVPVPGEQGDFLIWDKLLPHGNGHNHADEPRFAQYLNFYPADWSDVERREQRIETWRERKTPPGDPYPGDPREREKEHDPADLTPLGRKLLGLDPWQEWLE